MEQEIKCLFYILADDFLNISAKFQIKNWGKYDQYLKTKAVVILLCLSFPKEAKIAPSICSAFKVPILIRSDSLTSEESKTKNRL